MRYSFEEKLDRAKQHLHALEQEIERWLSTDPYIVIDDIDIKTGENVVRIRRKESTPTLISIVAGDVIHNLRCSLDHLVYSLADNYQRLHTRKSFVLGDVTDTQFPIYDSWEGFCNRGANYVRRIHPLAQAIIYGLQPCTAFDPHSQWLWRLRELSNIDKHRTINATLDIHSGTDLLLGTVGPFEYLRLIGRLQPDQSEAEIARYKTYSLDEQTTLVKMNINPITQVAFGYGRVNGHHVMQTLTSISSYIELEVVPLLVPYL